MLEKVSFNSKTIHFKGNLSQFGGKVIKAAKETVQTPYYASLFVLSDPAPLPGSYFINSLAVAGTFLKKIFSK